MANRNNACWNISGIFHGIFHGIFPEILEEYFMEFPNRISVEN